ncbi:histidine kinase [Chitinophaga sp. G-6-1-13]|uniref:Histidine kinase n=1 Tax=Chitinophaga fulva TaxID=2728842 RepID=A0A848GTR5_9BACT|nr:histidine kinase [Chitinophaga fulva]NML40030.1 histidine kinase [Chitinophaga fulva]
MHLSATVATLANFLDIRQVKPVKDIFYKVVEKGVGLHVIFVGALLFVLSIVTFSSRYAISLIPRAIFSFFLLLACAYTARWICRRWLFKDGWAVLVLLYVVAVVGFSVLGVAGYMYLLDFKFNADDYKIFFIGIPGFVVMFLFGGGLVTISRFARRTLLSEALISQQQQQGELSLLRAQISPHFLFNTLNNLYGLSITDHKKMPGLLLMLSELLRYSVYETGQQWVPLEDEIAYIRNYIELEKIRVEDRLDLHLQLCDGHGQVKIAPMLLIVFVENAFKHSKNTTGKKIQIALSLAVEDDGIVFSIGNSFGNYSHEHPGVKEASGVGIANTIKRLDLLYPGEYSLHQQKEQHYYKVELRLKVK